MRILQLSDVHFGPPEVPAHHRAVLARVATGCYDAIAIAGDLTQRSRPGQFRRAKGFVDACRASAPTIVVPGNHDVAWWWQPMGLGLGAGMTAGYRRWIDAEREPVLRVPGVIIVGVDSCHGIQSYTLTTRLRDLSVVGAVQPQQWARVKGVFDREPAGTLKVLMLHHNLVPGRLSRRWGLASRAQGVNDALTTGADLVLCGHDHEDHVERVEKCARRLVVSTSSTISDRSRGGKPASFQEIEVTPDALTVRTCAWDAARTDFVEGDGVRFAR